MQKEKERGSINLKWSKFTWQIINCAYLTMSSFAESNNVPLKITKAMLMYDILTANSNKAPLMYIVGNKKIDLDEAYSLAIEIINFICFDTYDFEGDVDREINAIKIYLENKDLINKLLEKSIYSNFAYTEIRRMTKLEKYQVGQALGLVDCLDFRKNDYSTEVYEYFCKLVIHKTINVKYEENNPTRNKTIDVVKEFIEKDGVTFKVLVNKVIEEIYIKKVRIEHSYIKPSSYIKLDDRLTDNITNIGNQVINT